MRIVKPAHRAWIMAYTVRAYPWPRIVDFYRGIPWAGAMADLAEAIASSPYHSGLHAITSMHTLVIGQSPEFEMGDCVLRIEPHTFAGGAITTIRFEYAESPLVRERWVRECTPGEAFGVLERFLARSHWFVEYRGEGSPAGNAAAG